MLINTIHSAKRVGVVNNFAIEVINKYNYTNIMIETVTMPLLCILER